MAVSPTAEKSTSRIVRASRRCPGCRASTNCVGQSPPTCQHFAHTSVRRVDLPPTPQRRAFAFNQLDSAHPFLMRHAVDVRVYSLSLQHVSTRISAVQRSGTPRPRSTPAHNRAKNVFWVHHQPCTTIVAVMPERQALLRHAAPTSLVHAMGRRKPASLKQHAYRRLDPHEDACPCPTGSIAIAPDPARRPSATTVSPNDEIP